MPKSLVAAFAFFGCLSAVVWGAPAEPCEFHYRVSRPGEQSSQELRFKLELNIATVQSGQTISSGETFAERRHARSVKTLKSSATAVTQAQVRFDVAEQRDGEGKAAKPDPSLEPVTGKSYIVTRDGDDLIVTGLTKAPMTDEEKAIVETAMETLGRPNPFGVFLDGRTLTIGEKVNLPHELARELLGFAGAKGDVTRCELKLEKVTTVDGARRAELSAVIAGQSDSDGMSLLLTGHIVLSPETCRVLEADFSGPVSVVEQHGPSIARYEVRSKGTLTTTLHVQPAIRQAKK